MAHQGQALKDIIERTTFSIADVADALEISRKTMYLWFAKEVPKKANVERVGKVIGVDIYRSFPEIFKTTTPPMYVDSATSRKKQSTQIAYWKMMHEEAMENISKLDFEIFNLKAENEDLKKQLTALKSSDNSKKK